MAGFVQRNFGIYPEDPEIPLFESRSMRNPESGTNSGCRSKYPAVCPKDPVRAAGIIKFICVLGYFKTILDLINFNKGGSLCERISLLHRLY